MDWHLYFVSKPTQYLSWEVFHLETLHDSAPNTIVAFNLIEIIERSWCKEWVKKMRELKEWKDCERLKRRTVDIHLWRHAQALTLITQSRRFQIIATIGILGIALQDPTPKLIILVSIFLAGDCLLTPSSKSTICRCKWPQGEGVN